MSHNHTQICCNLTSFLCSTCQPLCTIHLPPEKRQVLPQFLKDIKNVLIPSTPRGKRKGHENFAQWAKSCYSACSPLLPSFCGPCFYNVPTVQRFQRDGQNIIILKVFCPDHSHQNHVFYHSKGLEPLIIKEGQGCLSVVLIMSHFHA